MYKKFDKKLFEENDLLCRNKIKEIVKDFKNIVLEDNPKTRGVDIIIKNDKDEIIGYMEVERKLVWKGDFKYDTVNFPSRKMKYCTLDKPTIFVMFNHDFSEYMCTSGEVVRNSKMEMVRNKYVTFGEMFFKIDLDKVNFNNIKVELDKLGV